MSRNWLEMTPEDFGRPPAEMQEKLFPDPDPCGTGDLLLEADENT